MDLSKLHSEYQKIHPIATRFTDTLTQELYQLFSKDDLSLGVPIESRVKTWDSITDKIARRDLGISSIIDIDDLIGLRIIMLFKRDLNSVHGLLTNEFKVIEYEDTADRLDDMQFGYQSIHYNVRLKESWLKVPSFQDFSGLNVELQVRTLAQHNWAAASHKLQYQNEQSIPLPVRRSIFRVSALLETVDLELERVLDEREQYLSKITTISDNELLNVNTLERVLDDLLPEENKGYEEPHYSELLEELNKMGISTSRDFKKLISKNLKNAIKKDKERLNHINEIMGLGLEAQERAERGVFYTHVGLVRMMLIDEFGEVYRNLIKL